MAKIYARNKQYNGVSASVRFVNGVGEISDSSYLLEWFRDKGYDVVLDSNKETEHKVESEKATQSAETKERVGGPISPYAHMHKGELIQMLREKGFEVNERMKKRELLEMLEGAK